MLLMDIDEIRQPTIVADQKMYRHLNRKKVEDIKGFERAILLSVVSDSRKG